MSFVPGHCQAQAHRTARTDTWSVRRPRRWVKTSRCVEGLIPRGGGGVARSNHPRAGRPGPRRARSSPAPPTWEAVGGTRTLRVATAGQSSAAEPSSHRPVYAASVVEQFTVFWRLCSLENDGGPPPTRSAPTVPQLPSWADGIEVQHLGARTRQASQYVAVARERRGVARRLGAMPRYLRRSCVTSPPSARLASGGSTATWATSSLLLQSSASSGARSEHWRGAAVRAGRHHRFPIRAAAAASRVTGTEPRLSGRAVSGRPQPISSGGTRQ